MKDQRDVYSDGNASEAELTWRKIKQWSVLKNLPEISTWHLCEIAGEHDVRSISQQFSSALKVIRVG